MNFWKELIRSGLQEDGVFWDWTTRGCASKEIRRAEVIARSEGVWAIDSLLEAMRDIHPSLDFCAYYSDGSLFQKDSVLLAIEGPVYRLLLIERVFLNLSAYVCGVALATYRLVLKVKQKGTDYPPRVVLTRKILPGYRDLCVHGVLVGGGYPHRIGLSGGVLIKENHIRAAGGVTQAVVGARRVAPHGLKIEVEVQSEAELREALEVGVDGVLLDNFSPVQVCSALNLLNSARALRPFVEVSGGLNESNIMDYVLPGVDVLSVGYITHSVHSVDLSFLLC